MDSNNNTPINININTKSKNKKKETFDSETCENSNSDNAKIKKIYYKKSVDFFPKKMEIEEIDEDITKRRNTIDKCGNIKNFVPKIRPIKNDIIPSKLRLNKIGFKDLKCNKNNKVLLYANKYFISCPNIRDEEDNDEIDNPETRAKDLAAQLSIEEIAGLMLYSGHQAVRGPEITDPQKKFLEEDNLRAVLVTTVESPETAARWNNNVQAFVEALGHGIPANNSSDPRNETAATAEFNLGSGGKISLWPTTLGLAATFDPAIVEQFGQIASEEYRALGIATALSPQIDLATEPRWSRFNGTFGEDPALDTDMARAYVDGFQTTPGAKDGWGAKSVNAMVKHWPSGGPEEGGRDAHFNYGK